MKAAHKFGAKRATVDGVEFASKAEAKRWGELRLLERAGKIRDLVQQPGFRIFDKSGVRIEYIGDFFYRQEPEGDIVEDVKGFATEVYRMKRKMFLASHPGFSLYEIRKGVRKRVVLTPGGRCVTR